MPGGFIRSISAANTSMLNTLKVIDAYLREIVTQAADFAAELAAREAELAAAKAGLVARTLEIEKLKLQIARLRRVQFGRSSEKIARTIEQLELRLEDLEAETVVPAASAASPAADIEQSPSSSKGKRSGRRPLAEHLPRHEVVHEPSCTCPSCGGEMRKVGEDVTEVLDYVPGHFKVIKHIRPAFSCRRCESMVQAVPAPRLCPRIRGAAGQGEREASLPHHLLALAHDRACEAELAHAIDAGLDAGSLPDLDRLRGCFKPDHAVIPHVAVVLVPLSAYDELAAVRAPKTDLVLDGGVA